MMNKYHIRFNTKHNNNTDLVWRVFENGEEHLVKSLQIKALVFDECTVENGEKKWNICCEGAMRIVEDVAIIE